MIHKSAIRDSVCAHFTRVVRLVELIARSHKNEVERTHQLRTETRRAGAVLKIFGDGLPDQHKYWLTNQLKTICRKAGVVRDLDILGPLLTNELSEWPKGIERTLEDQLGDRRASKMKALRAYCHRLLSRDFAERFRKLSKKIVEKRRINRTEPDILNSSIDRLTAKFQVALDRLPTDDTQFHKVRIRARQLRYGLDFVNEIVPDRSLDQVRKQLAEIQETLGRIHDRMTGIRFVREQITNRESAGFEIDRAIREQELIIGSDLNSIIPVCIHQGEDIIRSLTAYLSEPQDFQGSQESNGS